MTLRFSAVAALIFSCAAAIAFHSHNTARAQAIGRMGQPGGPTGRAQIVPEELPRSQGGIEYHTGQPFHDGFGSHGYGGDGFGAYGHCADGGCADNYSGGYYPGWNDTCCETCGGYGGGCCGWAGGGAGVFVFADYLYSRASFSDALSHVERDIDESPQSISDRFHQLDFQHDSSYRFGGGLRLKNCGEEIQFVYTRLTSYADSAVPDGSLIPFDPAALDDEQATVHSFVDVDSFDLDYRKTIPLGGPLGGGCGDACGGGCGDACGCGCPAWDITWSGGLRYAEVDWNRFYRVFDEGGTASETSSVLNFEGGGPRIGIEGRRYLGQGGWFSLYLKGDVSLLLGHFDLVTQQRQEGGTGIADDIFLAQSIRGRHIVPVTEIEAGLTANVTCYSTITTGYLFSAWHDLGFRDEFAFVPALETHYDDANILGFDGFFARLELAY